jgi:hypothetical protein
MTKRVSEKPVFEHWPEAQVREIDLKNPWRLSKLPLSGIAKRWQHVAVGVSPQETGHNLRLSREAAPAIGATCC